MTNVGLAFALLPRYGLVGAAASTAIAQLVTFAIILGSSRATGVRFGEGTWMVVALPAVILLGPWASGAAVLAVTALALTTDWFLQPAEKRAALSLVGKRWRRCTTPSGI
jgi:O-antigen/teichoic acid export membrane protein